MSRQRAALLIDGQYLLECQRNLNTSVQIPLLRDYLEDHFNLSFFIKWVVVVEGETTPQHEAAMCKKYKESGFVVHRHSVKEKWPTCPRGDCAFHAQPIRVVCPELSCTYHAKERSIGVHRHSGVDALLSSKLLQLAYKSNCMNFVMVLGDGAYEVCLGGLGEDSRNVYFASFSSGKAGGALNEDLRPFAAPHPQGGEGIVNLCEVLSRIKGPDAPLPIVNSASSTASYGTTQERALSWQQTSDDLMAKFADALPSSSNTNKPPAQPQPEKTSDNVIPNIEAAAAAKPITMTVPPPLPDIDDPFATHRQQPAEAVIAPATAPIVESNAKKEPDVAPAEAQPVEPKPVDVKKDVIPETTPPALVQPSPAPPAPPAATPSPGPEAQSVVPSNPKLQVPKVTTDLPAGCTMHYDFKYFRFYYVVTQNGQKVTTWTHPMGINAQADVERQVRRHLSSVVDSTPTAIPQPQQHQPMVPPTSTQYTQPQSAIPFNQQQQQQQQQQQ
eukprot:PhM_4_TR15614/c1_g1_i1/m.84311